MADFCRHCGTQLSSKDSFCFTCGKKVDVPVEKPNTPKVIRTFGGIQMDDPAQVPIQEISSDFEVTEAPVTDPIHHKFIYVAIAAPLVISAFILVSRLASLIGLLGAFSGIFSVMFCGFDLSQLKKTGYQTKGLTPWVVLCWPVYLFKRAKLIGQKYTLARTSILAFLFFAISSLVALTTWSAPEIETGLVSVESSTPSEPDTSTISSNSTSDVIVQNYGEYDYLISALFLLCSPDYSNLNDSVDGSFLNVATLSVTPGNIENCADITERYFDLYCDFYSPILSDKIIIPEGYGVADTIKEIQALAAEELYDIKDLRDFVADIVNINGQQAVSNAQMQYADKITRGFVNPLEQHLLITYKANYVLSEILGCADKVLSYPDAIECLGYDVSKLYNLTSRNAMQTTPSSGTKETTPPVGISLDITQGEWYSDSSPSLVGADEEYLPALTFNADNTFNYRVNLLVGMSDISGTYSINGDTVECKITSGSLMGFRGADVKAFNLVMNDRVLVYKGDTIVVIGDGAVFKKRNPVAPEIAPETESKEEPSNIEPLMHFDVPSESVLTSGEKLSKEERLWAQNIKLEDDVICNMYIYAETYYGLDVHI